MKILDACCGSKLFWFDKNCTFATYMDIREETYEIFGKKVNVQPDIVADFRNMPFEDNTYDLVVFDPPHLKWAGKTSIMKAQYGQLDKDNWPKDIKQGMSECMRVLKPNGTFIFKWNENQVKLKEVLKAIEPYRPLFGNRRSETHWLVFNKQMDEAKTHQLTFLDLFSGIGGFRLGLEAAGHKCVGYVEIDEFARKSYEAMHDTTNEYTERDVNHIDTKKLPYADIWTFGFPCQDISIAGGQKGFTGNRSSLFFGVTRKLRELKEDKKPSYLIIENVKNLLSVNGGWDFAKLQIELDEIGYDTEWDVLNSKYVIPQNRERVYIIGHLRARSTREVFPITRESESVYSKQRDPEIVRVFNGRTEGTYSNQDILSPVGISTTLNTMQGGNREPKIIVEGTTLPSASSRTGQRDVVYSSEGLMGALIATDYKQPKQIVIPVITPDRIRKRQNGRRFKEDGDPSFTLTTQDRHGILIKNATKQGYLEALPGDGIDLHYPMSQARRARVQPQRTNTLTQSCNLGTVTPDFRIRKLTPKECWRLQGFPDDYMERAEKVNSNSQLYKQAGNSVTVPIIKLIAERLTNR